MSVRKKRKFVFLYQSRNFGANQPPPVQIKKPTNYKSTKSLINNRPPNSSPNRDFMTFINYELKNSK